MIQQTKTRHTKSGNGIGFLISCILLLSPGLLLAQTSSDGFYTIPPPSQNVVPATPPSIDPAEIAARQAADLAEVKSVVEEYRQAVASRDNLRIREAWRKLSINTQAQLYLQNTDPDLQAHFVERENIEKVNRTQQAFEAEKKVRPYSSMEGDKFNRMQTEDPLFTRQAPPDPATPGRGPDPDLADLVKNPRRRVPIQPPPESGTPQSTTKLLPPEGPPRSFDLGEGTVQRAPQSPPASPGTSGITAESAGPTIIVVALTAEEIIKCKEAGLTSGQCAERLITAGAALVGLSAAALATGTVPFALAVGSVYMTVKGYHDAVDIMYAGGSYRDAINNEKRIKQERVHQQELNAPSFAEQTSTLKANIISKVGSVSDALKGVCENLRGMAASATARSSEVQAALAGLPPAADLVQVRSAAAACEGTSEKKARLDALRDRVLTYSSQVSAALQRLEAKAQACSTKEQAQALLDDWSACVGLSKGIGQMSAEARGLAGELNTVRQQAAQAKSLCARAQSASDRVVALSGRTVGDSGIYDGEAARAEGLNTDLRSRADAAQREIVNLRRAFAVTPERDAVFSELRSLVERYQGETCPVDNYRRQFMNATAAAANARLDAQNRAAGLSGEMAGLALCDGLAGGDTLTQLDSAESDAGSYLLVNSDIPGRARECLARAENRRDGGQAGFASRGGENADSSSQGEGTRQGDGSISTASGSGGTGGGFSSGGGENVSLPGAGEGGPQPGNQQGGFGSSGGENVASGGSGTGDPRQQGQPSSSSGSSGGIDLLGTSSSQTGSAGPQPPFSANNFPEPPGGYGLDAAPPAQGYPPSFETGPSPADIAAAEEQRQRNQQMMADSLQNFANQLANMQRGNVPPPPVVAPAPRTPPVYTPQRSPATQGAALPYGPSVARSSPSGGTSVPNKTIQQEPPPSEAEKQALTREIEGLYVSKWKKYWCQKNWSGCAVVPSGAKDGLVSRAFYATKRSQIAAIRSTLYCWDPCIMGNLNDSLRAACQKRCDQQFGY